jgi:hypothetical protein
MSTARPCVAFISGPLDASEDYFNQHYKARIDVAISEGHHFVMGPVSGIDTMALHYLLDQHTSPSRITVYMANFEFSNPVLRGHFSALGVNTKNVGDASATTRDRDAQMTQESHYDILRYRTEAEAKELYGSGWWPRVSNTEMNERRRAGITSQAYKLNDDKGQEMRDQKQDDSLQKASIRASIAKLFKKG